MDISLSTPKFICDKCCTKLEAAYEFKKTSLRNYNLFQNYIHELQSATCKNMFCDIKILVTDLKSYEIEIEDGRYLEQCVESSLDEEALSDEELRLEGDEGDEGQTEIPKDLFSAQTQLNLNENGEDCPFACSICEKSYPTQVLLDIHLEKHAKKPYCCTICGKYYKIQSNLDLHVVMHSIENPFTCSTCDKSFSAKASLKRHMRSHIQDRPVHACPICGNRYKEKSSLNLHLSIHNNKQPHACTVCSKKYISRYSLRRHMFSYHLEFMKSEEKEFLFTCSICEKSFAGKFDLNSHMLMHSNLKPFTCSICPKSFVYKSTMKRHMALHSKIPQVHACLICGKRYKSSQTLKLHLCMHNNKWPHTCKACNKTFIRRDKLRRHMLKEHPKLVQNNEDNLVTTCEKTVQMISEEQQYYPIKLEPNDDEILIEEGPFGNVTIKDEVYENNSFISEEESI